MRLSLIGGSYLLPICRTRYHEFGDNFEHSPNIRQPKLEF
jgi:hypothetical protein